MRTLLYEVCYWFRLLPVGADNAGDSGVYVLFAEPVLETDAAPKRWVTICSAVSIRFTALSLMPIFYLPFNISTPVRYQTRRIAPKKFRKTTADSLSEWSL